MTPLGAALRRISTDLAQAGVKFALVGGIAVSERTTPRFTADVDLAVAVDSDRDAERVVSGLLRVGYRLFAQMEHLDTGRFATARLLLPAGEFQDEVAPVLDLLFAAAGIEPELVAQAEDMQVFGGLRAPVARIGHLLVLKLLSEDAHRRPQDGIDIAALMRRATAADIATARAAIELVHRRGCHRGKDLALLLEQARQRHGRDD